MNTPTDKLALRADPSGAASVIAEGVTRAVSLGTDRQTGANSRLRRGRDNFSRAGRSPRPRGRAAVSSIDHSTRAATCSSKRWRIRMNVRHLSCSDQRPHHGRARSQAGPCPCGPPTAWRSAAPHRRLSARTSPDIEFGVLGRLTKPLRRSSVTYGRRWRRTNVDHSRQSRHHRLGGRYLNEQDVRNVLPRTRPRPESLFSSPETTGCSAFYYRRS